MGASQCASYPQDLGPHSVCLLGCDPMTGADMAGPIVIITTIMHHLVGASVLGLQGDQTTQS